MPDQKHQPPYLQAAITTWYVVRAVPDTIAALSQLSSRALFAVNNLIFFAANCKTVFTIALRSSQVALIWRISIQYRPSIQYTQHEEKLTSVPRNFMNVADWKNSESGMLIIVCPANGHGNV